MAENETRGTGSGLPRLGAALLRRLLPPSEREEVLGDLALEYVERKESRGGAAARLWLWKQVVSSAPALVRRGWWRGWSGYSPKSDWMRPGGAILESWAMDARYALRRLRKRPAYTAVAVLTLALGVAGTAAVYSIAQRLLLAPLPVGAEEEVAVFWMEGAWSQAEFAYLRPQIEGFGNVAAFRRTDVTMSLGDGPARLVRGALGTTELFDVLGVRPAVGPGFRPGDDVHGAEPVAVLSHSLWRELGGDPGIVGQAIELSGIVRTVVGVMPPGFWFPDPGTRVWLSLHVNPENYAGNYGLIGRMPAGVGIEGMGGALDRIATVLGERFDYPEAWDPTANPELTSLRDYVVGSSRPAILALLGAMAVILLIAAVNVAALMLGQVDARGTELAVRTALGAARPRLLRQLLVESLAIGALAGLAGTGMALVAFHYLSAALPLGELADVVSVNWTLFWAAMVIALAAATAVALGPAVFVARSDLRARITRSRTAGIGGRGSRLEGGLVVAQVALVLLMTAGAALLIRSVANLRAIDPGVDTRGVAVIDVVTPVTLDHEDRTRTVRDVVAALEALPGVRSAAATQRLPLRGSSDNWGIVVENRPDLETTTTAFRVVTADYFETMGIRLRSGRLLQETDRLGTEEGVVVINRALADRYFPGIDPIGQRIAFMSGRWDRIVGIVDDVAESTLTTGPEPARYMLYEQVPWLLPGQTIVLRTETGRDPGALLHGARQAVHAAAPGVAVQELTTLESVFDRAIGPARQLMSLLTLLSALALVLGVVGVYGVVSHFVTRRRRDWGIRIALGMRPADVIRRILASGATLIGAGIGLGLVAFLLLARLLGGFLHDVGTTDPWALASAMALLMAAGILAALIPARRASRIDPVAVLREE